MIDQNSFIGKRFGKVICIAIAEPKVLKSGYTAKQMLCRCDCGREKIILCSTLINPKRINGCGICYKEQRTTHGHARRGEKFSREYRIWRAMVRRCTDTKLEKYANYGGRGITVCERWMDFNNFLADMGKCPSEKHSIHRKDNDKGYDAENCKWADDIEQANNKTNTKVYTVRGITGTLAQLCRHFGIPYQRTNMRIWHGKPIEQALFDPKGNSLAAAPDAPQPE